MSPETFVGWVLGVLDIVGDELTSEHVALIRARAESVATGVRTNTARPAPVAASSPAVEAQSLNERVAEIQGRAKTISKKAPRRPPPDPLAMAGLPEVVSME